MEELRRALLRQRPLLTQLIVASVIINLLGLFLPLFSMAVFDRVIPHAAFETLWALALGVVLALGVELALRMARLKLFDAVGLSISHGLQGRAAGRLLGAGLPTCPSAAARRSSRRRRWTGCPSSARSSPSACSSTCPSSSS